MSSLKHHTTRRKPRKNCGPKLTARVRNLTSELYNTCQEQARTEIPFPDLNIEESPGTLQDYINDIKTRSSELYQERIKTLPTKDLEDILWVHECGTFTRAPFTIEAITSELAKRQLFE